MSGTVVVVLAVIALASPILMAWATHLLQRSAQKQNWERQDEVAKRVAEAADLLVASNATQAKASKVTDGKLDQIHALVNSKMTEQMELLVQSLENNVVLMRRTGADEEVIDATVGKIRELKEALADRANL